MKQGGRRRRAAANRTERAFSSSLPQVDLSTVRHALVNFGIDVLMSKYYGSLKSYACYPPLVWTENDKSTSDIGDPGMATGP